MTDIDWSKCPEASRDPEIMSGAWVLRGTRMPVSGVIENIQAGATIDDVMEWFGGLDRHDVEAIVSFAGLRLGQDKYDWRGCKAVQFDPEKLSGRANVEGQRMFADGILENYLDGLSVDEIVDSYGVRREAVEEILAFAAAKGLKETA